MDTMKAIRMHSYGGPDVLVLEDAPRPEYAADALLIRVCGAGVNPLDWKVRSGILKPFLRHSFPLIPGGEVSGVVEAVGSQVGDFKVGDSVFALLDFARDGAYAEFLAAPARDFAPKPLSLPHVQAAAVPMAALTAWQALFDVAHLTPGQTVLIHGAAGGVGHLAVQLAIWKGAQVIGTASARNLEFLKELGVAQAVDYHQERFEEVVKPVDVVLDTIGGNTQRRSLKVVKKSGVLVSTVGVLADDDLAGSEVRRLPVLVRRDAPLLNRIGALIDSGAIRPVVSAVFQLPEAGQAQELSESGHARGKIVLRVAACP
ncbi:NADP-dependent oxidoreductase [Geomesophilobacter sediminis]|uniref:NADP-dependent oxidoreductase n=1 Tax=Geomesophilobacter sediminis TaxID=2798584 RepID=A0A8J7INV2_9BACT|nr:NADP-dependent oxidoreductase [Geomesophilobacter sediminis]MBJ6723844.1 NADP-dependent oxidoreductase [Geomesophilobacter sediminis]